MLPCKALVEHLVLIVHEGMQYPESISYLSKDQGVKASAAARTDIHTACEAARGVHLYLVALSPCRLELEQLGVDVSVLELTPCDFHGLAYGVRNIKNRLAPFRVAVAVAVLYTD